MSLIYFLENLEEEDKSAENDEETIENQSKLDVENLIKSKIYDRSIDNR